MALHEATSANDNRNQEGEEIPSYDWRQWRKKSVSWRRDERDLPQTERDAFSIISRQFLFLLWFKLSAENHLDIFFFGSVITKYAKW